MFPIKIYLERLLNFLTEFLLLLGTPVIQTISTLSSFPTFINFTPVLFRKKKKMQQPVTSETTLRLNVYD